MNDPFLLLLGCGTFLAALLFLIIGVSIEIRNPLKVIVSFLCLVTIVGRCYVPHVAPSWPGTFEALAHVFCGILLGLWLSGRDRFYVVNLIIITVFEGVMFFLTK